MEEESFAKRRYINRLHIELGNPLEVIVQATKKAMCLQFDQHILTCNDCSLGKGKKAGVSKVAFLQLKLKKAIYRYLLAFYISCLLPKTGTIMLGLTF